MINYWNEFIISFCKVDFLCYNWETNWLGGVVLVIGGVWLFGLAFTVIVFFIY